MEMSTLDWNDDQLPIGVDFLARFGNEATLFRLRPTRAAAALGAPGPASAT
jgi:hypothetical protein